AADGAADFLDGGDGVLRRHLHAGDLGRDLFGRLGGLRGERFHLARDDRKAAAGFARACRLDGGVKRQQIGLLGDRGDQFYDIADATGGLRELVDARVGPLRLIDGVAGDPARLLNLTADLVDVRR